MEEDLVKRLYNEAIKWEGSSPEGLLIRAADEILKLRKQLSNQLDAVVMQKIADTKKEFDEKFVPYKPYYQTQRGIIYWTDLWKWFEEKLSNFSL